ncbi:MAG TPA: extracellular solute-binding protein [Falsiroseomonas sp.]|nr:extracellular solute-binding protein [Falsiroseomonas sp.]
MILGRRTACLSAIAAAFAVSRPALAQARDVVAYTAFSDGLTALAPGFKARSGADVQIVAAGSGELVRRLLAERTRPLADCIVSVGGEPIDANPALFARYTVEGDAMILDAVKVSPNWIPFSVTIPNVVAVNTRLVPEAEIPSTWAELADPKWKGKIAYAGADRSGSALQQMLQILYNLGEDEGWRLFERMLENFVITGSSGAVPRGVAQGEYALGVTLEDFAGRYIAGGAPVRVVYPREGITLGADAMALVAGGPNPDGGRALLDYIASVEGQTLIVQRFGRRPIRTDVPPPAGAADPSTLPIKNIPVEWSNARQREALARYLRLVRR